MPWYKTGTVSVTQNSNAVIGTGTAFIANSRVGDAFRGPDGGWYEVTNIASDTAMSIAPPYQGATNAAGTYALAPMQGYVKDSADALRALVNQFGGVIAVLGNTPTQLGVRAALNLTDTDGLPEGLANKYMSAAGVRGIVLTGLDPAVGGAVVATDTILAALGKLQVAKAAKGANADITSLAGLTTALSLAQGGTGVTTIAALVAALQTAGVYGKSNLIGTVSQASGVPTGAVIERGSNTNGVYVKFADGTMICTFDNINVSPINNGVGSLYTCGNTSWTFPATYAVRPVVIGTANAPDPDTFWVSARSISTTAAQVAGWSPSVRSSGWVASALAIGRWF